MFTFNREISSARTVSTGAGQKFWNALRADTTPHPVHKKIFVY
ncbi:hypothetical protein [Moraxella caprae]|nr:hypothetical protein [Moraxella caprae]